MIKLFDLLNGTRLRKKNVYLQYSNQEQFTGEYWIDGKKIYCKTVAVNFGASTTVTPHNIANINAIVEAKISWYDTLDKAYRFESRYDNESTFLKLGFINNTNIVIGCSGSEWQNRTRDRYVTLYYTKNN